MSNININPNDNPTRRQSSLGGNVRFRDAGNVEGNYGIFLAYVTHVYYQEGTLDFDARDTIENLVDVGLGKGLGQAPIPVETFGTNSDGKVYGQYRPINVGDKVAIAYLNGSRRTPIVIGVYPKNSSSYELVSPVPFNMKNESDDEAEVTTLSDKKIYPSQQVFYQSGKGDIFRSLGGHSFMTLNEDQMDFTKDLDYAYDAISAFYDNNGEQLNPQEDKAQAWLLVHEDNPDSNSADGHRTRFYVAKDGEVQLVFTNSNNPGILILQGSLDKGLTIKKQYDTSVIDDDSSNEYVTLNIGGDSGFSLDVHNVSGNNLTRSAKNSTNFAVKSDDVYVNNVSLTDLIGENADDIQQIIDNNQKYNQEYFDKLDKSTKEAGQIARNAARDAHEAGAHAHDAGEQAKATSKDIKDRIMYYMNISPEEDVYVPNKYLIIHTDTFIEDATIKQGMIDDLAVGTAQIAYEAVGTAEIEDLAVSSAKIDNLAVTDEKVGHLTFDHMIGEQIDANTIDVVNLHGDNITAGTITADKILINGLGDLSHHLGDITDGHIQSGDNGVIIDDLPADDPDQWTPAKKALLKQQIGILEAEANATIQYGDNVGIKSDVVENAKNDLINGTATLLTNMTKTEKFSNAEIQAWITALKTAVEDFRNEANNTLIKKVGTTESGNNIYQGPEEPDVSKVHLGDIWFKEYEKDGKKTYEQLVYGNDGWYSPSDYNVTQIQEQLDKLPTPYYQADEPQGDLKKDDTWYKTSTDSNGNISYTAYKYDGHDWQPMLDNNVNKNTSGTSAPANPRPGDQWYDETTKELKQLNDQGTDWIVIPTQGPQGVPGTDGKTTYTWIKFATSESGANISDNPKGMSYIGIAYNKPTATESSVPTDYTWTKIKGEDGKNGTNGKDGIQGPKGSDGKDSYTWIKYADSPTSGMSDNSDGKQFIGISTNHDTATESNNYEDYSWARLWDASKKRNFTDTPTTPYDVGDTWTQSGATLYCIKARQSGAFSASDWNTQQITLTSLDTALQQQVKAGTDARDGLDNLQIGGRNLIENSQPTNDSGWFFSSGSTNHYKVVDGQYIELTRTGGSYHQINRQYQNDKDGWYSEIKPGDHFVISMDVSMTTVPTIDSNFYGQLRLNADTPGSPFNSSRTMWNLKNIIKKANTWYRVSAVTTIPNNWETDFTKATMARFMIQSQSGSDTDVIRIRNIQLEKGTKATDWTPAPEDVDGKINGLDYENRNLLVDTTGTQTLKGTNGSNVLISTYYFSLGNYVDWGKINEKYTLSFDYKLEGDTKTGKLKPQLWGAPWSTLGVVTFNDSNSSGHFEQTQVSNNTWVDSNSTAEGIQFRTDGLQGTLSVWNVKLEKGTKATEWTIAPEELLSQKESYKGVTLNDAGLTATAGSTQVALNSSDGFLIKKGSSTLFNTDTSGNLNMQGNITAGNISGVNFTGNNLTLAGSLKTIGSLMSGNGKVTLSNTGLNIKGAGLTIGDSSGKTTTMISEDGTFTANKAVLSGSLTSNSVNITGGTINMNGGAFSVSEDGEVTAKNFIATGQGEISASLLKMGVIDASKITLQGPNSSLYMDNSGINIGSSVEGKTWSTHIGDSAMDFSGYNPTSDSEGIIGGISYGMSDSNQGSISLYTSSNQYAGSGFDGGTVDIGTSMGFSTQELPNKFDKSRVKAGYYNRITHKFFTNEDDVTSDFIATESHTEFLWLTLNGSWKWINANRNSIATYWDKDKKYVAQAPIEDGLNKIPNNSKIAYVTIGINFKDETSQLGEKPAYKDWLDSANYAFQFSEDATSTGSFIRNRSGLSYVASDNIEGEYYRKGRGFHWYDAHYLENYFAGRITINGAQDPLLFGAYKLPQSKYPDSYQPTIASGTANANNHKFSSSGIEFQYGELNPFGNINVANINMRISGKTKPTQSNQVWKFNVISWSDIKGSMLTLTNGKGGIAMYSDGNVFFYSNTHGIRIKLTEINKKLR